MLATQCAPADLARFKFWPSRACFAVFYPDPALASDNFKRGLVCFSSHDIFLIYQEVTIPGGTKRERGALCARPFLSRPNMPDPARHIARNLSDMPQNVFDRVNGDCERVHAEPLGLCKGRADKSLSLRHSSAEKLRTARHNLCRQFLNISILAA